MKIPITRKEAIEIIDAEGKREKLEEQALGSLEEYFEAFSDREPGIWFRAFTAVGIEGKATSDDLWRRMSDAMRERDFEKAHVVAEIGILFGLDKGSLEI